MLPDNSIAAYDQMANCLKILEDGVRILDEEFIHVAQRTLDINIAHDKFGHVGDKHLRKTLFSIGVEATGTSSKYEACMLSKAKHKVVKKVT